MSLLDRLSIMHHTFLHVNATDYFCMKTVSIHQPHYLIWLGLLDKIAKNDLFVLLDNVQYKKRYFQNRTRYSTKTGVKLLSLPVKCKHVQTHKTAIKNISLADDSALKKHLTTLKHRYGKTPGWKLLKDQLYDIYTKDHLNLVSINHDLLNLTLSSYQITTPVINASDLNVSGQKSDLILSILKEVKADHYLSGKGAKSYMEDTLFTEANINVSYQDFIHPTYNQKVNSSFSSACFALEWFFIDPEAAINHFQPIINQRHY